MGVFIAGRLSSERLPNKLILPIGDTCLWEEALEKLNTLPDHIDKYALCSDSELVKMASKYSKVTVINRDPDTSEVDGPLNYIFKEMKNVASTHLMFLNPCLFYLTRQTILESLSLFEQSDHEYGTSVKAYQNWLFDSEGEKLMPINYERLTTKEIKTTYQAAHCFHIFNKEQFFYDGQMLKDGFMMLNVPENETTDVDTRRDFESLLYQVESKKKRDIARHIKLYSEQDLPIHIIDVDETICSTSFRDYSLATPLYERIEYFNSLFEEGALIIYSTARGYIYKDDFVYRLTKNQLTKWGAKHHFLITGEKLPGSYYWDDKAVNIVEFFEEDEWIE